MSEWLDKESKHCHFKDKRIGNRFRQVLSSVAASPGETIPKACQDWAETKAVYRFLSNERVSAQDILGGHIHETSKRIAACKGPVLALHDTSEFTFKRKDPKPIGSTRKLPTNKSNNMPRSVNYRRIHRQPMPISRHLKLVYLACQISRP